MAREWSAVPGHAPRSGCAVEVVASRPGSPPPAPDETVEKTGEQSQPLRDHLSRGTAQPGLESGRPETFLDLGLASGQSVGALRRAGLALELVTRERSLNRVRVSPRLAAIW